MKVEIDSNKIFEQMRESIEKLVVDTVTKQIDKIFSGAFKVNVREAQPVGHVDRIIPTPEQIESFKRAGNIGDIVWGSAFHPVPTHKLTEEQENRLVASGIKNYPTAKSVSCDCPINILMTAGCKCGKIKEERSA